MLSAESIAVAIGAISKTIWAEWLANPSYIIKCIGQFRHRDRIFTHCEVPQYRNGVAALMPLPDTPIS